MQLAAVKAAAEQLAAVVATAVIFRALEAKAAKLGESGGGGRGDGFM